MGREVNCLGCVAREPVPEDATCANDIAEANAMAAIAGCRRFGIDVVVSDLCAYHRAMLAFGEQATSDQS